MLYTGIWSLSIFVIDQNYDDFYGQTHVQDIHISNHLRRNAPDDIKREANRIIRKLDRKWPGEGPGIYDPIGSNRYQLSFMINMLAYNFKKRKERRGLDPWNTRDFGRWLNTSISREE